MKEQLLRWLVCPLCGAGLSLAGGARDGEEIREGDLACAGCSARYPVVRGIPRLLPRALAADAMDTAARFGEGWTRFDEIRPQYEAQFRGWIAPVGPEAFAGRRVLDAGCGKGRHLRLAAAFGAREVIGMDLGPAVEVAARNTADLPNVHVIQADLVRPPIRRESVELIYSIGVLHHLRDPASGFRALAPLLTRDGLFVAWLYAREGNGWIMALVDPIRRLSSRLPIPLVSGLAWVLTVPLWAGLRALYAPAVRRPRLGRWLPYASYLFDLLPFPFREIHYIVFDQLLAPVAHYMRRPDVERCFEAGGLRIRSLRWHHANSWAASGTRLDAGR